MATTYLALLNGVSSGDTLEAANWNKVTDANDRTGYMFYGLLGGGRVNGWGITSGTSTVASGTGNVGACWCVTNSSQVISNLADSSTNYVFAQTDAGSPASGTIDFVARTTSAAITNADGETNAVLLGKGAYVAATGFTTVDTSIRTNWNIDHGGLSGLADDDHSQYMQDRVVELYPDAAWMPATSGATTSQFGSVFRTGVVKYPALSTQEAGWNFICPPDYSGNIVVHTDWLSSGLAGPIRLGIFARNRADGETWDATVASCLAATQLTISGSNGQLKRYSHSWTATLPSVGERGTVVIRRSGANASDTMSGTARLLSARVMFDTAL